MCGRYVTGTDEHDWRSWARLLDLSIDVVPSDLPTMFVPTASVPIVRWEGAGPVLDTARWGLAPSWMDQPLAKPPQYNVRAETAQVKFRKYFFRKRCLLPASGFWLRTGDGRDDRAFVRVPGQPLFAFGGIWTERELQRSEAGILAQTLRSCTILTIDADPSLGAVHERMPVVLDPAAARRWLAPDTEFEELEALCRSHPPLALA